MINNVWHKAKLRGVTFRAIGQEPGWLLEITHGESILLESNYGETRIRMPYVEPLVFQQERRTQYPVDAHDTVIEIHGETCHDTMSGEEFENSVLVKQAGGEMRGCGRALLDVTEKDLQHHRWVLESINNAAFLAQSAEDSIPDLDFGEQMHVSGNTGCNQYSGKAVLRNGFFLIESMLSTQRLCGTTQNELELKLQTMLNHESVITLDPYKRLTLQSAGTLLVFRLRDWVQ